ncbi:MAG: NAD(P)/FAD-dependent oxidoreductase [Deltaproteobacteria bacterium]|nr:NAD(P)/FAD-dependent oxidoreductase [Deltaproteobacteria bacterium]
MTEPSPQSPSRSAYDVVVIGGGPAGTTFAHLMKKRGFEVLLLERDRHPRFTIGESLLPGTAKVWRELGLEEALEQAGFLRKYGAYFSLADRRGVRFVNFADGARASSPFAYEVPRAQFDLLLWNSARTAGVECLDATRAEQVWFEGDRAAGVDLELADGTRRRVAGRLLADCSGRSTLLGRQRAMRERDPRLNKIALYAHFDGVRHSTGTDAGTIGLVAGSFGWAWIIPFGEGRTSVGVTMDNAWYARRRRAGMDHEALWNEAVQRLPPLAARLHGAVRTREIEATADFQYKLRDLAGDGWVVIGDAGNFVDPIFSSGVHLAMIGARRASRAAEAALRDGRLPRARDFDRYVAKSRASLKVFSKFIHAWYDPPFREVFIEPPDLRGIGWLRREVTSILAGHESPSWRTLPVLGLLVQLARLNEWLQGGPKTLLPKNERDRAKRLRLSAQRRAERRAAR